MVILLINILFLGGVFGTRSLDAALVFVIPSVLGYATAVSVFSDWLVRKIGRWERFAAFLIHLAGGIPFAFIFGSSWTFFIMFSVPNSILYWAIDEWMKSRAKRQLTERKTEESAT